MLNRIFNHVNLMEKGIDAMSLRQEVIANNIANADTPGYKSQHVEFESIFRQAIEDQTGFQMKTSSPNHITSSRGNPLEVNPVVVSETWHTARMDGGNVDPDQEMTELAMNTIRMNMAMQQTSDELRRLKTAITGT